MIISVGTMTHAIKAKKAVQRADIEAKLVKIISEKSEGGCMYGIKLDSRRFYDAVVQLKNEGIDYTVYSDK